MKHGEVLMHPDEKVYCMVKEIQLMLPPEFRNVVPVLGSLHLIRSALKVIGKYLDGCGVNYVWLKADIFDQNSVLMVPSLRRMRDHTNMSLIYWWSWSKVSWERMCLRVRSTCLSFHEQGPSWLLIFPPSYKSSQRKMKISSTGLSFFRSMHVVRDLLRADREELWCLHIDAVQISHYHLLHLISCYFRCAFVYPDSMRSLPTTKRCV